MTTKSRAEKHKGILNGIEYNLTRVEWVKFLEGKSVFDNITENCMRLRFKGQAKTGITNEQALGITELRKYQKIKQNKTSPLVKKSEMPMYQKANKFLRGRLI